jgi:iron(III) transport system substrate-binding protein
MWRSTGLAVCIAILGGAPLVRAADDLAAGAKKEAEINLYLSTDLSDANGIIQAFRKKYPFVDVKFFRAGNDKLLNRILTETSAGKFNGDVVLISSFEIRVLLQKKLLQKYLSPESSHYAEGFTDKDGYWTSVYSIPRVVAYNTKLVRAEAAPKSYEDLIQPRWKNSFCMSDSAVLWYTGFLKFYGEEKGREYMKKLSAQKPLFRDSESIITQLMAAGEFPLGLTYLHQVGTMKRRGAPVDWIRTAQPIVTGLKPISLSAKAAHPNAGKLFIDFVLSKESQELIRGFNRISGRVDVGSDVTEGTRLYPAEPRWGDDYSKHVEEFRSIFLK